MDKPSKAIVGPYTYTIAYDRASINQAQVDESSELSGRCDPSALRICIHPDLAKGSTKTTLLHEILHALFDITGLRAAGIEHSQEEAIVAALEAPLLRFIRDNGPLIDYLYEEE